MINWHRDDGSLMLCNAFRVLITGHRRGTNHEWTGSITFRK